MPKKKGIWKLPGAISARRVHAILAQDSRAKLANAKHERFELLSDITFHNVPERRGWLSNLTGIIAERRLVEIVENQKSSWPYWLRGVRMATDEEDKREQTDALILTIHGPVRIQVKASVTQVKKFYEKNTRERETSSLLRHISDKVIVIAVEATKTDEEIFSTLTAKIQRRLKKLSS